MGTLLALVLVLALVIAVGTWIATYRALTEGSSGAIEHTTPRRGPCLIWSGCRATSRRRRFGSFTTARTGGKNTRGREACPKTNIAWSGVEGSCRSVGRACCTRWTAEEDEFAEFNEFPTPYARAPARRRVLLDRNKLTKLSKLTQKPTQTVANSAQAVATTTEEVTRLTRLHRRTNPRRVKGS